jgi:hypothetical protein
MSATDVMVTSRLTDEPVVAVDLTLTFAVTTGGSAQLLDDP